MFKMASFLKRLLKKDVLNPAYDLLLFSFLYLRILPLSMTTLFLKLVGFNLISTKNIFCKMHAQFAIIYSLA